MKKALLASAMAFAFTTQLHAGGLDRSGQGVNILFKEGNVVQLSFSRTNPSITGFSSAASGSVPSGNVGQSFNSPGFAYKTSLTDKLDFAVIYDRPYGAHIEYPSSYPLSVNPLSPTTPGNLRAEATSDAITALLRYKFDNGFSVHGGVFGQRLEAEISVPRALGYDVSGDSSTDFGYVLGVAWEKPEIAARVALTYRSEVNHTISQTETGAAPGLPPTPFNGSSQSDVTTPQSINLDFQTGIAPKTLLFGTVRWVDWPTLSYSPPNYIANPIVSYDSATTSYSLGLGYQFFDNFAGAVVLGYEDSVDQTQSDFGPTNGSFTSGLVGTYTVDKAEISGGVFYTQTGDSVTDTGAVFDDNDAWSFGFQVTYTLG